MQYQNAETDISHLEGVTNASTIGNLENDTVQEFQKAEVLSTNSVVTSENTINHDKVHYSTEETINTESVQEINTSEAASKVDFYDLPKVQKEHLLEMASAVADVLTNESEHIETSLDTDLMYHNQFLSPYMEEQKKVVNELHIELSNAVSVYMYINFIKSI